MRLNLLITVLGLIIFTACGKNGDDDKKFGYPNGMKEGDMTTLTSCILPMCSEDRVIRLIANNAKGQIWIDTSGTEAIYGMSYNFTFDSYLRIYICDLPEAFQIEGLDVKYSGDLIDDCGIFNPLFPVEESYILRINEMERI